jgi:ABC-2 type transport system ATP-binding protein
MRMSASAGPEDAALQAPAPPAIETRALTKRFGARSAIDAVDLRVPAGCAFGFLGPNGAGKTTMIRMLLGLIRPSSGSMRLLGLDLPAHRAEALQRVGAIVEEPRFHPHLTGRENLAIIAAARGAGSAERIDRSLERVGLGTRADEKVKRYSLGMRQRLGVARCLLADPQLLILDEPTNGLDPAGIQEFRELIRSFVEQEGRTVFLSSHLLDEVERICDQAAIVDRGRVIVQGPLGELTQTGERNVVLIGVDDSEAALALLEGSRLVGAIERVDGALQVTLTGAPESAAALNAQLVSAGIGVMRLEPLRQNLEERFLAVTSGLRAEGNELADDGRARA